MLKPIVVFFLIISVISNFPVDNEIEFGPGIGHLVDRSSDLVGYFGLISNECPNCHVYWEPPSYNTKSLILVPLFIENVWVLITTDTFISQPEQHRQFDVYDSTNVLEKHPGRVKDICVYLGINLLDCKMNKDNENASWINLCFNARWAALDQKFTGLSYHHVELMKFELYIGRLFMINIIELGKLTQYESSVPITRSSIIKYEIDPSNSFHNPNHNINNQARDIESAANLPFDHFGLSPSQISAIFGLSQMYVISRINDFKRRSTRRQDKSFETNFNDALRLLESLSSIPKPMFSSSCKNTFQDIEMIPLVIWLTKELKYEEGEVAILTGIPKCFIKLITQESTNEAANQTQIQHFHEWLLKRAPKVDVPIKQLENDANIYADLEKAIEELKIELGGLKFRLRHDQIAKFAKIEQRISRDTCHRLRKRNNKDFETLKKSLRKVKFALENVKIPFPTVYYTDAFKNVSERDFLIVWLSEMKKLKSNDIETLLDVPADIVDFIVEEYKNENQIFSIDETRINFFETWLNKRAEDLSIVINNGMNDPELDALEEMIFLVDDVDEI
ncbi:hypothetical protein O9G_000678 [Rozella allomycis CSF55]|uniref:Uncharacterized protein n=1 Tax=Rozella allomycis (strain CSF55) TaxID=988480 RepID=A0A075AYC6_ROZAC|nr:hypothetical protein O9G_000678 [Rozella allomycis CSF55]|eukprot:EPZ35282.1 hypothetical protein O9G_000678 [Rozella allomycis CSF55]